MEQVNTQPIGRQLRFRAKNRRTNRGGGPALIKKHRSKRGLGKGADAATKKLLLTGVDGVRSIEEEAYRTQLGGWKEGDIRSD